MNYIVNSYSLNIIFKLKKRALEFIGSFCLVELDYKLKKTKQVLFIPTLKSIVTARHAYKSPSHTRRSNINMQAQGLKSSQNILT